MESPAAHRAGSNSGVSVRASQFVVLCAELCAPLEDVPFSRSAGVCRRRYIEKAKVKGARPNSPPFHQKPRRGAKSAAARTRQQSPLNGQVPVLASANVLCMHCVRNGTAPRGNVCLVLMCASFQFPSAIGLTDANPLTANSASE